MVLEFLAGKRLTVILSLPLTVLRRVGARILTKHEPKTFLDAGAHIDEKSDIAKLPFLGAKTADQVAKEGTKKIFVRIWIYTLPRRRKKTLNNSLKFKRKYRKSW